MRKIGWVIGCLLGLGLLGLGLCGGVVWQRTRRPHDRTAPPAPAAFVARAVSLQAADGTWSAGSFFPQDPAQGVLVLLHGSGESRSRWYPLLAFLARQRVSALLLDMRGHGESAGDTYDGGFQAGGDVVAAVEWLAREAPQRPRCVVGYSMGAAAAIYAAPQLGGMVDAYLLEACYADRRQADGDRLRARLPAPLAAAAAWGMSRWYPYFYGHDVDADSPREWLRRWPGDRPLVLLGATGDPYAAPAVQRELAAAAGEVQLVLYEGSGHRALLDRDRQRFQHLLGDLLALDASSTGR